MIWLGLIGFLLVLWIAKLQRDHLRRQQERRDRQRAQQLGASPLARVRSSGDLDAEEERLLAILRERQSRSESEG